MVDTVVSKKLRDTNLSNDEIVSLVTNELAKMQAKYEPESDDGGIYDPDFREQSYELISVFFNEYQKRDSNIEFRTYNLFHFFDNAKLSFVHFINDETAYELHSILNDEFVNVYKWFLRICIKHKLITVDVKHGIECKKMAWLRDAAKKEYEDTIQSYLSEGESEQDLLKRLSGGAKFNLWDEENDVNLPEIEFYGLIKKLIPVLELHPWEVDSEFEIYEFEEGVTFFNLEIGNDKIFIYDCYVELRKNMSITEALDQIILLLNQYSVNRMKFLTSNSLSKFTAQDWMYDLL